MDSNEIQQKAALIQQDFQAKMQALMQAGRHAEIPTLVSEMQAAMQSLTKSIEQSADQHLRSEGRFARKVFDTTYTTLDLDRIAHPSDHEFFLTLNDRSSLYEAITELKTNRKSHARRRLLANAMRLTPNVSKDFFEIVEHCKKTLGYKGELDLFVIHDHGFNAGVFPRAGEKLPIYFTSGLLENFSRPELAFVIGHELGHALFGHIDVSVESLIETYGHLFSSRDVIGLRSWQRSAEFSADRMGLLCAGDFNSACVAFFKLSSGITSTNFRFSMADYMDQFKDLESYIKETPPEQMEELYSSHPLNPVRLRALELFSESKLYRKLSNKDASGALDDEEMEAKIKTFVQLLEPTYLDDTGKTAGLIREFMFLTGYMLAKSNGIVDPREVEQLSALLASGEAAQRLQTLQTLEEQQIIEQIVALAEKIQFEVAPVQRLNIIRDVFTVATADGVVEDSEIAEMSKICGVLGIMPTFIDELLRGLPQTAEAA